MTNHITDVRAKHIVFVNVDGRHIQMAPDTPSLHRRQASLRREGRRRYYLGTVHKSVYQQVKK